MIFLFVVKIITNFHPHPPMTIAWHSFFFFGEYSANFYFFIFSFVSCFIYLFFFISWGLITLQYCSGFCHTLRRISHHSFLDIAFVCYHCFMSVLACYFSAYRNFTEYRPIYYLMKFIYASSCMTDIERFTLIKHNSNSTFCYLILQI